MPGQTKTFRVDARLWDRFGALCKRRGTSRSALLAEMMQRELRKKVAVRRKPRR